MTTSAVSKQFTVNFSAEVTEMNLLANGLSRGDELTVVALCMIIVAVMAINFLLLVFLHKKNRKIAKEDEVLAPDDTDTEKR